MPDRYLLGLDIGGTFTDFVLLDTDSGGVAVYKCLTTPRDPAEGVLAGTEELLRREGVELSALGTIVHSTTLVTNAILERRGAPTGLLITRGFKDLPDLRTEQRYDIHDLFLTYPEPLVPLQMRREVSERVLRDGRVLEPLDESGAMTAAAELVEAGVQSLAIVLLHAYRYGDHEQRLAALLRERYPNLFLSTSASVAPSIGEYERATTTMADAYVKPILDRYLLQLDETFRRLGFEGRFYVMLSAGASGSLETALRYPIRLTESGPAAGAVAAGHYARQLGAEAVVSFDMGGTTAKAAMVEHGRPEVGKSIEVDRVHRFTPGSGLPLVVPSVELIEIGAGGGSVASVDSLGLLKVGPHSAGAEPGPACYARGGTDPTVTDADLLLGYLDPDYFLGGQMKLDRAAAERAFGRLAEQLGYETPVEAAWGVHNVVNESMAQAARMHLIERNRDPRRFTLVAFGGAGPGHAGRVARTLGISRVVCPLAAGATSAFGCLTSPFSFEIVRSYPGLVAELQWDELNTLLQAMEAEARQALISAGIPADEVQLVRTAEMRLSRQMHRIEVPVPDGGLGPDTYEPLYRAFRETYERLYTRYSEENPLYVDLWRVVASSQPEPLPTPSVDLAAGGARKGHRLAFFPEVSGFVETPVYDRYQLAVGAELSGPAIVEEREATAIVGPYDSARIDENLNLVIQLSATKAAPRPLVSTAARKEHP